MARKIVAGSLLAMIFIAILLAGFMAIGPRYGWDTHPVMSGSMEPVLKVGGLIVTKPERLEDVRVGDIITYDTGGRHKVTHRVVGIVQIDGRPNFQTKGDANPSADRDLVTSTGDEIRKVVLFISYAGFAAQFMRNDWVFPLLIGIPSVILIVMLAREIRRAVLEEQGRRRAASYTRAVRQKRERRRAAEEREVVLEEQEAGWNEEEGRSAAREWAEAETGRTAEDRE